MKLYTLITIALISNFISFGQAPATFKNDTAIYAGHSFTLNDTIHVGYGSKADKGFGFIRMGSTMQGYSDLDKGFARYDAIIDKIQKVGNIIYIRAKAISAALNMLGGNKILIDLERAIDNKELKFIL